MQKKNKDSNWLLTKKKILKSGRIHSSIIFLNFRKTIFPASFINFQV